MSLCGISLLALFWGTWHASIIPYLVKKSFVESGRKKKVMEGECNFIYTYIFISIITL